MIHKREELLKHLSKRNVDELYDYALYLSNRETEESVQALREELDKLDKYNKNVRALILEKVNNLIDDCPHNWSFRKRSDNHDGYSLCEYRVTETYRCMRCGLEKTNQYMEMP